MNKFVFRTKDLEESAFYLVQPGVTLEKVEAKDGLKRKVIWFVFSFPMTEDEFYELKFKYLQGKSLVEPLKFSKARADLKQIIRSKNFQG
jgi:hypothetical protein